MASQSSTNESRSLFQLGCGCYQSTVPVSRLVAADHATLRQQVRDEDTEKGSGHGEIVARYRA